MLFLAKSSPLMAQTGTDNVISWSGCAHSKMSSICFSPLKLLYLLYLLCYILLEQLSFSKVTVFTHICSYQ